jgi:filamentous hemagglutinin
LELQRLEGQRTLPFNTPTIDDFTENGVAVSIKSIDLNAPWYANSLNLSRQIDSYVDKLGAFSGMRWGGFEIAASDINGKVLDIVVPQNSGTSAQLQAIETSIERASDLDIHVFISRY